MDIPPTKVASEATESDAPTSRQDATLILELQIDESATDSRPNTAKSDPTCKEDKSEEAALTIWGPSIEQGPRM